MNNNGEKMPFTTIEQAAEDFRNGRMVIIVDDEDRENEGDLCLAAEKVTPDAVNFMAKFGRGLICLPMTGERLEKLGIPMMVENNTARYETAFCVSIEARKGVTTGISAADRAHTVKVAIDPSSRPEDLARPGHMFPLKAQKGGVLKRAGQTEASVDLARIAGLYPAAMICEIMNEDGTMSRMPQLEKFADEHKLSIITVKDLISYRLKNESFVRRAAETVIPTEFGEFKLIAYENDLDNKTHLALVMGDVSGGEAALVRVHSECLTGDVFGSMRCDCGQQLRMALSKISCEKRGALLYLRQEGRGIGLVSKIKAYQLQDHGKDTVEANTELGYLPDQRDYGVGAQILRDLGLTRIKVMTNNPKKFIGLEGYGIIIIERIPLEVEPGERNKNYLRTKKDKLGHLLSSV